MKKKSKKRKRKKKRTTNSGSDTHKNEQAYPLFVWFLLTRLLIYSVYVCCVLLCTVPCLFFLLFTVTNWLNVWKLLQMCCARKKKTILNRNNTEFYTYDEKDTRIYGNYIKCDCFMQWSERREDTARMCASISATFFFLSFVRLVAVFISGGLYCAFSLFSCLFLAFFHIHVSMIVKYISSLELSFFSLHLTDAKCRVKLSLLIV